MKSDFLIAITQLAAEKRLPKEVVLEAVETALISAYKKENAAITQVVIARVDPNTGEFKLFAEKAVVETVLDPQVEISLSEAVKQKKDITTGTILSVPVVLPTGAGRIAAQTAKQVVLQRLKEAERDAIYEEYATKQEDIVTGTILRKDPSKNIFLELGRTEALLPPSEQISNERYRIGQRIRVFVIEVARTIKGTQVIVSRTHRNLLKRLFEMEVPETLNSTVEIKRIAREPGQRSKVAVAASQPGVDAVGSCVGQRGIRIQNIVNELGGEKIDVVLWDEDPSVFIANALSPAHVLNVRVSPVQKTATVVVPDRQLSLAIGKEGQNARLAARLTGWKIDIKSATIAEDEKARVDPEGEAILAKLEKQPVAASVTGEQKMAIPFDVPARHEEPPVPTPEEPFPIVEPITLESTAQATQKSLRFAEDILTQRPLADEGRGKKAKKKGTVKKEREEGTKPKKTRYEKNDYLDDEDEIV
ncbi:MAG: transcription termination factor NusA [Dehalococcoidia bacterium]|nr:transcription termination factor NusA [Dehalococcoidia bacterium]